jgi:hypothetical protein
MIKIGNKPGGQAMSLEINNRSHVSGSFAPLQFVEEIESLDVLIIEERNRDMKNIEKDLEDLLATHRMILPMITEQGENIEKADENVIHVNEKIVVGVKSLKNAEVQANKFRRTGIFATIGGTSGLGIGAIGFAFGPHVGILTTLLALGVGAATGAIISKLQPQK